MCIVVTIDVDWYLTSEAFKQIMKRCFFSKWLIWTLLVSERTSITDVSKIEVLFTIHMAKLFVWQKCSLELARVYQSFAYNTRDGVQLRRFAYTHRYEYDKLTENRNVNRCRSCQTSLLNTMTDLNRLQKPLQKLYLICMYVICVVFWRSMDNQWCRIK